jgi:hypothetical protein
MAYLNFNKTAFLTAELSFLRGIPYFTSSFWGFPINRVNSSSWGFMLFSCVLCTLKPQDRSQVARVSICVVLHPSSTQWYIIWVIFKPSNFTVTVTVTVSVTGLLADILQRAQWVSLTSCIHSWTYWEAATKRIINGDNPESYHKVYLLF